MKLDIAKEFKKFSRENISIPRTKVIKSRRKKYLNDIREKEMKKEMKENN